MPSINRQLRAESVFMAALVLLPLILGLLVLFVAPPVVEWLAPDRCLDAGGRYDAERGICVLSSEE